MEKLVCLEVSRNYYSSKMAKCSELDYVILTIRENGRYNIDKYAGTAVKNAIKENAKQFVNLKLAANGKVVLTPVENGKRKQTVAASNFKENARRFYSVAKKCDVELPDTIKYLEECKNTFEWHLDEGKTRIVIADNGFILECKVKTPFMVRAFDTSVDTMNAALQLYQLISRAPKRNLYVDIVMKNGQILNRELKKR